MFIYCITNSANGKVYVGQTKGTPEKRFTNHLCDADRGVDSPLCHAIRKYGKEAFALSILRDGLNVDSIDAAEIALIKEHRSYIHDTNSNGYNQTRGGKGWSSDVCLVMAKTRKRDGYSAAAKKRADKLVAAGSHNFVGEAGSENARQRNAKWVEEGTHPAYKTRTCPHCGFEGRGVGIFRYHFDRCPSREKILP